MNFLIYSILLYLCIGITVLFAYQSYKILKPVADL